MMAVNINNVISISQPMVPIFKGVSYLIWSVKIKIVFLTHDLWDLVENDLPKYDAQEGRLTISKKKKNQMKKKGCNGPILHPSNFGWDDVPKNNGSSLVKGSVGIASRRTWV